MLLVTMPTTELNRLVWRLGARGAALWLHLCWWNTELWVRHVCRLRRGRLKSQEKLLGYNLWQIPPGLHCGFYISLMLPFFAFVQTQPLLYFLWGFFFSSKINWLIVRFNAIWKAIGTTVICNDLKCEAMRAGVISHRKKGPAAHESHSKTIVT